VSASTSKGAIVRRLDSGPATKMPVRLSAVIGKWFESYDEAWTHLLTRETPLHISIQGVAHDPAPSRVRVLLDEAREIWAEEPGCEIVLQHANCFHDAAVVEAHTEGVPRLLGALNPDADLRVAPPHMTVAYLQSPSVVSIRHALNEFRGREFGSFHAASVRLCLIPIARSTFLCPWEVARTQPLLHA
jgi:2'-5' RNA ligase